MKYRADIDGLRAIAVVPVMFFHAGFELFSGGFVGVDVFFVISGYLITTLLIEEFENRRFNIVNFYERRARRILPALFVVMLACIPFAWIWMLPAQMQNFSQSLIAVSLFGSNIFFWRKTGYFAESAEENPLLHTWSLAVEEQYYVVFPIFLLLAWRFGKNRVFWMIIVFAAISLALSEWGWRNRATANFYLAPTRAWELLAGSIAAFIVQKRGVQSNNVYASIGLAAILFAIFAYDEKTPFPSVYALVPVTGVFLLVLYADKDTLPGKFLSMKALVGVGLLSYSAYLWHQPILAFTKIRLFEPNEVVLLTAVAATFILSYVSWRFVEQPFRKRGGLVVTRKTLFATSAFGALLFIGIGVIGHSSNGFIGGSVARKSLFDLEKRIEANYGLHPSCDGGFNTSLDCMTATESEVLLWGDSFAMHLAQGILASNPQVKLQQQTNSSCSPILGVSRFSTHWQSNWAEHCIKFNDDVFSWLKESHSVNLVVLSSPFGWVNNEDFVDRQGRVNQASVDLILPHVVETMRQIRALGKSVVLVSPTPRSGRDIGRCLLHEAVFDSPNRCNFELNRNTTPDLLLTRLAEKEPVYWLYKDICGENECQAKQSGYFIYKDSGHLSKEGSAYLGRRFEWLEQFALVANSPPNYVD